MPKERKSDIGGVQLRRVRRICTALPEATEKLSHGEPTFFVRKKVFAMFANNHHNDGYIAVWVPAAPGLQAMLIHNSPQTFFRPPYVGVRGWVGIELDAIGDEELASHIYDAWRLVAPKTLQMVTAGQLLPTTGGTKRSSSGFLGRKKSKSHPSSA